MKDHEELVKEGFKLIYSGRANEIYALLLTEPHTATELSKIVYPNLHKNVKSKVQINNRKAKFPKRDKPSTIILNYISAFVDLNWITPDKKRFYNRNIKYTATYKPYFEYLRHKNPKIRLSQEEINFMVKYWLYDYEPSKTNLYLDLDNTLKQDYVDLYLRDIFSLNKPKLRKLLKRELDFEEIIFAKLTKILYDKFTVELIIKYLKYLLEDVNNNSEMYVHIKKMIRLFER